MKRAPRPSIPRGGRARRGRKRAGAGRRPVWIALSLGGILALQLLMCRGRLGAPFLDTRLHYHHDNARFSFMARSGNRNGDLRSQFGVTTNAYARWGERSGEPSYYTDHPVLMKALFQQYARLAGTGEAASRVFSLTLSFLTAAGLYTVLLATTGSLLAALAGAATLVTLPLFAVYQTSVKFETDGMVVAVWLFAALAAWLRRRRRAALAAYGLLTALAWLTHWTAIVFAACLAVYLLAMFVRRRDPAHGRALVVGAGASVLGAGLLAACLSYLQGGWRAARSALAEAFSRRSAPISSASWWARQAMYARQNFTGAMAWIAPGLAAYLAGRWAWSRGRPVEAVADAAPDAPRRDPLLALFFFSTLAVACVWQFAFRQGSYVHVYWQYWFCLPIAALVAAALASLRDRPRAFAAGAVACAVLIAHLFSASRASYAGVLADELGKPEDIAFLRSLREDRFDRLVFVPLTDSPLNAWFEGPLFEYYTDRPVTIASAPADLRPGSKALVLRYQQRGEVVQRLSEWAGVTLAREACGERLCAYDIVGR